MQKKATPSKEKGQSFDCLGTPGGNIPLRGYFSTLPLTSKLDAPCARKIEPNSASHSLAEQVLCAEGIAKEPAARAGSL